jgi:hypothetical protein
VVDCPFQRIRVIGSTAIELLTGEEGDQVLYDGDPFTAGGRVACGSIVVVETTDEPDGTGIELDVRTVPQVLSTAPGESARAPGAGSGLVLIRPEVPRGVTADIRATWEDNDGRLYATTWQVNGTGRSVGTLVECPLLRIGWGSLRTAATPGATILGDPDIELVAPPRLINLDEADAAETATFECGEAVTLRVAEEETDTGFALETIAESDEATVPDGAIDLFANIRELLDSEGMAGRLSNSGQLLPEPTEPPAE